MFDDLMTDTVDLLSKKGAQVRGLKASVQSRKIFIDGASVVIETGDIITRQLSNGTEEAYEVIDPGFHEAFHGIPAGYQIDVRKVGIPERHKPESHVTYNISGHNARLNQNSVDNSTNIAVADAELLRHVHQIRSEIQNALISSEDRQHASEVLDVAEQQIRSGTPKKSVISALLRTFPDIAQITSAVNTLLSLLPQ